MAPTVIDLVRKALQSTLKGRSDALYCFIHVLNIMLQLLHISSEDAIMICHNCRIGLKGHTMIGAAQLRGARALLGIDRRQLALLSGLSVQTIQRMETSEDIVRGNVDSLTRLITALNGAGIEFIAPGAVSTAGGRGVRLTEEGANKRAAPTDSDARAA